MRRIHIQLSDAQERAVRRRAGKTGSSIAGVVRDAIDRLVASDDAGSPYQQVLDVFGRYKSTARDVSEKHDRYLADAFDR